MSHHGSAKIGRMAVLKSYRGKGVEKIAPAGCCDGKKLAREHLLHAQVPVIEFYEKLGFARSAVFNEAASTPENDSEKTENGHKNAKNTKNVGAQHAAPV